MFNLCPNVQGQGFAIPTISPKIGKKYMCKTCKAWEHFGNNPNEFRNNGASQKNLGKIWTKKKTSPYEQNLRSKLPL